MTAELIVPRSRLEAHFGQVEKILKAHASGTAEPQLVTEWLTNSVVTGIVGTGCEVIQRNRGRAAQVAPAWRLSGETFAWIGYREEWALEPAAGATQRYSFRSTGITIHFGSIGEIDKPQMFRAEWSGFAKWSGDSYAFQAGNAGHPHWQFDAVDSLSSDEYSNEAKSLIGEIKSSDTEDIIREFSEEMISDGIQNNLTCAKKLSRVHFASAASWWKSDVSGAHAHAPNSVADLSTWLEGTLAYLSEELVRLR